MKVKKKFTVTLLPVFFNLSLALIGMIIIFIIIYIMTSDPPYLAMLISFTLVIILPCLAIMTWQKRFKVTVNDYTITVRRWIGRKCSFDVSQIVKIDWRTVETAYGANDIIKISTASNHVTIESLMKGVDDMKAYILENVDSSIINRTYEDPFNIKGNRNSGNI